MINPTLSLLKYLSNAGFGKIDQNLFWEKLGLNKNGVFIQSLGETQELHGRRICRYQLYSRAKNDLDGFNQLETIIDHINNSYASICTLPGVLAKSGREMAEAIPNVTMLPLSSPANQGEDSDGRIIWTATGQIQY